MINDINLNTPSELSIATLLINLVVGLIFSLLITWHYRKFANPLCNRDELARTIPFVTLAIILIITIVKSSLALSLGLVGALSIVRFRTPIKEPEELAYLFLAIATGLGLGADQRLATSASILFILIAIALIKLFYNSPNDRNENLLLHFSIKRNAKEDLINQLQNNIMNYCDFIALRHLNNDNGELSCSYDIQLKKTELLPKMIMSLESEFLDSSVSIIGKDS